MVSQLDFAEVVEGVSRAGYWFAAVIALWAFLYLFNAAAWWIIIQTADSEHNDSKGTTRQRGEKPLSFWWIYKVVISGFALNYATPGGLMGGEPYKIMMLSPAIGTERASSSVILHTMTHIFSHFWFWLLSCAIFVISEPVNLFMALLLSAVTIFCLTAIWFFLKGYKRGIAHRLASILSHLPFIRKKATLFIERHHEKLETIDKQIATLHNQNPRTFVLAVSLELICRILSAFEIFFILLVINPDEASYTQCILILAFTSLLANLLFFIPFQLGGREGGFLISANGLRLSASAGIFVALIVRLREIIWTGIGLLLIKIEKKEK